MDTLHLIDLKKCRISIQRLSDSKLFYGWISDVKSGQLAFIEVSSGEGLKVGDLLRVEVDAPKATGSFHASVVRSDSTACAIHVSEEIGILPYHNESRKKISGLVAHIRLPWIELAEPVQDISSHGVSILAKAPLETDEHVDVKLEFDGREVEVGATVRYCRKIDSETGKYRIGFLVDQPTRLEQAKWQKIVDEAA